MNKPEDHLMMIYYNFLDASFYFVRIIKAKRDLSL